MTLQSSSAISDNTISEDDVETVRKNYGEDRPVYDTKIIDLDFDGKDELLVLTTQANPKVFEVWEKNTDAMNLVCTFGAGKVNWIDEISLKQGEIGGEKAYLFSFAYNDENSMKADEVLSVIKKTADGYEVEHLLSHGTIAYPNIAEPVTKEFYRKGWSKYDIGMDKDYGEISKEEYEKLYKEYTGEESPANSKVDILSDDNGGPFTLGSSSPTVLWDWADGTYEGSCLPLYRGRKVYTNYKFKTSTKQLTVDLEMYADENWTNARKLTVILYKKSTFGWSDCGQWTFPFSPLDSDQSKIFTGSHTFKALSDSAEYCVKLVNDSADQGGDASEYAIDCNICVSE